MNVHRRAALSLLVSLASGLLLGTSLARAEEPAWYLKRGLAASGYDPVAYFTESRAVKGDPALEIEWNGARWRFASAANRDRFQKEPAKYAPQFGGYCAWAVSQGYTASTDPQAWSVVDGKLYLNYSQGVRRDWEKDARGNIAKGEHQWPAVLKK